MSATTQIDYDQLAKQHGGVPVAPGAVDYDALAKEHGGSEIPSGVQNPGFTPTDTAKAEGSSLLGQIGEGARDLYTGASKGLLNTTIAGPSRLIHSLPVVGPKIIPDQGLNALTQSLQPSNTAEKVGHAIEQGAEFLTPMGEETAATKAMSLFPKIGKFAGPAARIATSAVGTGALNKLQGGDFGTGAAMGAAGAAAAPVLRKAGEGLAEVAAGPGKRLLKSVPEDVNIGRTVLENSSKVTPKGITKQLESRIATHNRTLENSIDAADRAGQVGSILPARAEINREMKQAVAQNAPEYIKDVGATRDQLRYQYGENGQPVTRATAPATRQGAGFMPVQIAQPSAHVPVELPENLPASKLRQLKRGISTSIGNWNPENQGAGKALEKRVYGAINQPFHTIVGPEGEAADKAMTSLIPARDAMWNTSYNPSVTRSVFNRIARPTGALAGGLTGAYEGHKQGGLPGAVVGGGLGLVIPEFVASPTGQMIGARAISSPALRRFGTGMTLQIARPSREDDERTREQ